MTLDRCFVRDKLAALTQDLALGSAVKECILYCPSAVLMDRELVDTPGLGSTDPLQWRQLSDALTAADGVLVVMQKGLEANADLQDELEASGVLRRLTDGGCRLLLVSALGEKAFCTAETFVKTMVKSGRHASEKQEGAPPRPSPAVVWGARGPSGVRKVERGSR